jgi:hypothetical protein
MGAINGDVPKYVVNYTNSGAQLSEAFEGEGAFSDACDFYERAKANPSVSRVDMSRLDGRQWKWVHRPQCRDDAGGWVPDA